MNFLPTTLLSPNHGPRNFGSIIQLFRRLKRTNTNSIVVTFLVILWAVSLSHAQTPEVKINSGHLNGTISTWAISKDGRFIATGGTDKQVIVWDAKTLTPITILSEHLKEITGVSFSPDGKWLATSSGWDKLDDDGKEPRLVIWNLETYKKETQIDVPGWITRLAFAHDGEHIIVGTKKSTRQWRARRGNTFYTERESVGENGLQIVNVASKKIVASLIDTLNSKNEYPTTITVENSDIFVASDKARLYKWKLNEKMYQNFSKHFYPGESFYKVEKGWTISSKGYSVGFATQKFKKLEIVDANSLKSVGTLNYPQESDFRANKIQFATISKLGTTVLAKNSNEKYFLWNLQQKSDASQFYRIKPDTIQYKSARSGLPMSLSIEDARPGNEEHLFYFITKSGIGILNTNDGSVRVGGDLGNQNAKFFASLKKNGKLMYIGKYDAAKELDIKSLSVEQDQIQSNGELKVLSDQFYYRKNIVPGRKGIFVYSASENKPVYSYTYPDTSDVTFVTIHPKEHKLAYIINRKIQGQNLTDKELIIIDFPSGKEIFNLSGKKEFSGFTYNTMVGVAFAHQDGVIAIQTYEGDVETFNYNTGQQLNQLAKFNSARIYSRLGIKEVNLKGKIEGIQFDPKSRDVYTFHFGGGVYKWNFSTPVTAKSKGFTTTKDHMGFAPVKMEYSGFDNVITSWDVSRDGKYIAVGGKALDALVWDAQTGRLIKRISHQGLVNFVSFSSDDRYLITGSDDGSIRFWNTNDRDNILTYYDFGGDAQMLVDQDSYYFAKKDIVTDVNFSLNNKSYAFDQFDLLYNRPDRIIKAILPEDQNLQSMFYQAYGKRLKKMGFEENELSANNLGTLPTVSILENVSNLQTTSAPELTLTLNAESKDAVLKKVFVNVNGVPEFGQSGKDISMEKSQQWEETVSIPLNTGLNSIEISVLNEKGLESLSEKFAITYTPQTPTKPNLHVIAIGVSQFMQSEFNLTYADKDANDLISALKGKTSDFGEIIIHSITNTEAKKEKVLALRSALEKTHVDDYVVVFVATHGLLDDELDYYLAMNDTDFANPKKGGLRYDELENLIDGIPARHKLMLLDACHSGEVDKEETEVLAVNNSNSGAVKSRGFKRVTTKATNSGIGLKTSFELMKELFADLRRNNGAVVISSASGQEYAFESNEWKNGVFTYALLEGLKTEKADTDKNGKIQVSEIREYVGERVKALTNGKQNPTSRTENLENDFVVW